MPSFRQSDVQGTAAVTQRAVRSLKRYVDGNYPPIADVTAIETDVTALTGDVTTLSGDVSTLEDIQVLAALRADEE